MNAKRRLAFLMTILFLPACYNMVKRDAGFEFQKAPPEVIRFLSILEQRNDAVKSFKGIGKVSVWDSGRSRTSRAAWLGAADGRLRIEFLGLPGQPVAKLIFDGNRYSFLSHIDQQLYRKTCSDPNLKQVTGVSIKASEVIEYLAGGVPIYEHDSVSFESGESGEQVESGGKFVLVFRKHWLGVVEKIFFNESVLEKVEIFRWGKKAYQVEFKDIRTVKEHQVPFYLVIKNAGNQGFSFTVDMHWADINVLPSMFEITSMD
ncbi:MAG: DUF4292 domain-containing protein [Desulfobacteraceae bacterium]|nr:DUF4292 domain-containing protein [Desulfobacteraceae bacterium]MBC2756688.1 DUF4292 domain-containing protein [Desulfobacteraceae bacterium]